MTYVVNELIEGLSDALFDHNPVIFAFRGHVLDYLEKGSDLTQVFRETRLQLLDQVWTPEIVGVQNDVAHAETQVVHHYLLMGSGFDHTQQIYFQRFNLSLLRALLFKSHKVDFKLVFENIACMEVLAF